MLPSGGQEPPLTRNSGPFLWSIALTESPCSGGGGISGRGGGSRRPRDEARPSGSDERMLPDSAVQFVRAGPQNTESERRLRREAHCPATAALPDQRIAWLSGPPALSASTAGQQGPALHGPGAASAPQPASGDPQRCGVGGGAHGRRQSSLPGTRWQGPPAGQAAAPVHTTDTQRMSRQWARPSRLAMATVKPDGPCRMRRM